MEFCGSSKSVGIWTLAFQEKLNNVINKWKKIVALGVVLLIKLY